MLSQAPVVLTGSGTTAVIPFLNQQENQLQAAQTYAKLVKHLYWQEKNVPDMVLLARSGIQYALHAGAGAARRDAGLALNIRSEAKGIAYNLASFTWIGWDEPGITLVESDSAYGLQAARLNLRLAFELDKGDMRISRAYWMEGAQLMAAGTPAQSQGSFARAAIYAARAAAEADELIARGFELLVTLLQRQTPKDETALAGVKDQLLQIEHGQMYVDQLDTARRVFTPAR